MLRKECNGQVMEYETTEVPVTVVPAKRLQNDAEVLSNLTKFTEPPLKEVRCVKQSSISLGGGDASGRCFGGYYFCLMKPTLDMDNGRKA